MNLDDQIKDYKKEKKVTPNEKIIQETIEASN